MIDLSSAGKSLKKFKNIKEKDLINMMMALQLKDVKNRDPKWAKNRRKSKAIPKRDWSRLTKELRPLFDESRLDALREAREMKTQLRTSLAHSFKKLLN